MKPHFNRALITLLLLSLFSSVLYVACKPGKTCDALVCGHGGVCNKGTYGETYCTCPSGYTGSNCATAMRNKFLGNWSLIIDTPVAVQRPISIVAGKEITDVIIRNLDPVIDSVVPAYTMEDDQLSIQTQVINHITVSGTITYSGQGHLEFQYNLTDSTRHTIHKIAHN